MFSSAKLSPSHYILCCLARRCSKIQTCHLFSPKPCLTGNQPYLDNWNFTSQLCWTASPFSSVSNPHPILIMCQAAWKDLSVTLFQSLFGFHGLAWWLFRKQQREKKQSRRRGEICFTSVLFRENQSRSRQRIHKTAKASVKRAHTQTRRGVCTSSGILYTSWLTEIDKGTNKQVILRH